MRCGRCGMRPKARHEEVVRVEKEQDFAVALKALETEDEQKKKTATELIEVMFGAYAVLGLIAFLLYRRLSPAIEPQRVHDAPLRESKRTVFTLASLFSLDACPSDLTNQRNSCMLTIT